LPGRDNAPGLQNVAAQILVFDDIGELLADVSAIDLDVFLLQVGAFEGNLFQQLFRDGMETAGADIFRLVDVLVAGRCTLVYTMAQLGLFCLGSQVN